MLLEAIGKQKFVPSANLDRIPVMNFYFIHKTVIQKINLTVMNRIVKSLGFYNRIGLKFRYQIKIVKFSPDFQN